ncbi:MULTISPECIES: hypothetical protein [Larkinella]|jgi:hypothetical protein|uniref:Uncharacterized protein n=1 Tax=Larkinella humicola TaxID=2607654 RepID=A0A5N1JRC9_9BACT|nr:MULTISPECIES: hypothetical protein [Larkinella]KAA9356872.1 hypothetical protein F0P93_03785 [Larkinella humicola]
MNRSPEQTYDSLLSATTATVMNPFGKTAVNPIAKPVITSTILRAISPQESTVIVQEVAKLLDAFSGCQYGEVLRWILVYIQESKKLRKRFKADEMSAILLLIESFTRIDQTFALRKKGGQSCR